jgi:type I restriction enzyme M protein
VWFYDLRTNKHFTLKTRQLRLDDLKDFVVLQPRKPARAQGNRALQVLSYDELIARDKASLDIFWLKDDSLENWTTCRPGRVAAGDHRAPGGCAGRVP